MTRRKRLLEKLIPQVVGFDSIDLDLTMDDIVADLRAGWNVRRQPGNDDTARDRKAA